MKAIFLGKFQPPHLGHIRTIFKISKEYTSLIIGITAGEPKIIEYEQVKSIIEEIIEGGRNISLKIIDGTIEDGTSDLSEIDFDIVLSGNQKVLDALQKKGYRTKFQPRTEGVGYSGSEIRGLIEGKKATFIENRARGYDFKILPLSSLKPLELVYPSHFKNIEKLLCKEGIMNRPIIIDARYNIVLDGSHRYAFLLKHGFKYAPVIVVNYEDDSIFVGNNLRHRYLMDEEFRITKFEVISRALNESLFNARTTRHFFPFRKIDHPIDLDELEPGTPKNIDYLIQKCTIEDEIQANRDYIEELDVEFRVIDDYRKEQAGVKDYLTYQLNEMEKEGVARA